MLKKSLAILIPVLIIGGCIYFYFHLQKKELSQSTAIKAIPIDASFILESRKTLPLWKSISQTSDAWKEILDIPYFNKLNIQLEMLDSIVRENPELGTILETQPLFVSAHASGMNRFNYLFICSIPETNAQSILLNYLSALKTNSPADNLQYEETTIHCIKIDGKNTFYYTISNGIFISSFAPAIIKESLRQLESGISLMQNTYFTKVLNTINEQTIANIFINFQTFTNVSSSLFNKSFLTSLSSLQDFGQWMELDVTINPDEFIMAGFTDCDSAGSQFLNLFQRQSSHELGAAAVAPANTAYMVCHEFSDYNGFHKSYLKYLSIHNKGRSRAEWINRVNEDYDLNIEKYFYSWINNEVAQIITEPSDSTLKNDTYVLIQANDITVAMDKLSALSDSIASKKSMKATDTTYMQHKIYLLNLDNVTGNIFGNTFDGVTKSWFTAIGNYVVFANSTDALKTFIYEYEGGKTLEKDNYYKDYIKQHVESESGIYIYDNMSLSSVFYAKYIDKSYLADMKKHQNAFNNFHAASIQFSYLQGMFYTNLYFKRNPSLSKEISPSWQTKLDTTLAVRPYWVSDYSTHDQYVLTEDKNEFVYLINSNGHIEWKKKITGYIKSPIYQVDVLKNHKIQYLFNTTNNINLIDRKGNDVSGFPIKLKYSASAPVNVFDYDKTKNYKLLIPCDNMKIYEYDINGKQIHGWNIPITSETVKCAAHCIQVDKKDYIIFIDDAGKVYAFDRKGDERLNLSNRMPAHIRDFYIMPGKELSNSYIVTADSMGTVFKLSLTGELATLQYLKGTNNSTYFTPIVKDSSGKLEMIFLRGSNLLAYNADKTECFHVSIKNKSDENPLVFDYPDHTIRIGAVDKKNERIYLWDNSGNLCPGFPLYGSVDFDIADMKNDGVLYLITGTDSKVSAYRLQ